MFLIKYLSIFLLNFVFVISAYLEARSNFLKPRLERNNIVNKRVWVKNAHSYEKTMIPGHFIFRPNSLDADSNYENNIEQFDGSSVQSFSLFPSYMQRSKRSLSKLLRTKRETVDNQNNTENNLFDNTRKKSETLSILKNYPYAKFLTYVEPSPSAPPSYEEFSYKPNNMTGSSIEYTDDISKVKIMEGKYENNSTESQDLSNGNVSYIPINLSDINKKIKYKDFFNKSDNTVKHERDVLDKINLWQHSTLDTNTPPGSPTIVNIPKGKPMTERGLVKVLSLLAKFFKKMSRQHDDVKKLHKKLQGLNDDFIQSTDLITNKLHNFDIKYLFLLKLNDNIKQIEAKIKSKEKDFDTKKNALSKYVKELELEQKKFLIQQQQFYNVQKLLLMQNEKITSKQNMIARTQVEISRRQNNFARLLKKSKHLFVSPPRPKSTTQAPVPEPTKTTTKATTTTVTTTTTTAAPPVSQDPITTVEPVKFNLFSITPMKGLENHDDQILREKDEKSVDDLIYKYYFNNTFIDNLIKKKILADFLLSDNNEIIPNNKNKRNNGKNIVKKTTILIPLPGNGMRQKRWIRHHTNSARQRNRDKSTTVPAKDDVKIVNLRTKHSVDKVPTPENFIAPLNIIMPKTDPFRNMASSFCKEIGEDKNEQSLKWCIEKALRKLKFMSNKGMQKINVKNGPPVTKLVSELPLPPVTKVTTTTTTTTTVKSPTTVTVRMTSQGPKDAKDFANIYFPDNDQLETYLQQFELKADPEGTVYYDGSLHTSDIGDTKSDGVSDIRPELDSHSGIQIDTRTFDRHARKLGYVANLNSKLLKKLSIH